MDGRGSAEPDQPLVRHVNRVRSRASPRSGRTTFRRLTCRLRGRCRSDQGGELAANWAAPNSATVGLNRPFAGIGGQTVTVNLVEPGTLHGDRVNQIDLRFAKILRFGRTRTNVGFDIYNITNAAPVLTYNETFIPDQAVVDLVDADLGAAAALHQSSARSSISDATKTEVDAPVGSDLLVRLS